jgi:5,10-methylenetetrahydromethanopterin reductase
MKHELSIAFQTDKSASEYIALAQFVNQYNFDAVTVYCDAPFHPSYAPLMLMAPHIERARIGVAAVSPFRIHPMDIASQAALLADVAQGDTYIGVARGAWLSDYAIEERKPTLTAIRESVEVIRYFLEGRDDGYEGEVFQIAKNARAPYPLPKKPIPILMGTWGKKLCAIAGEIADEVKVGGSTNPDVVPVIRDYIRVGAERAGRDANTVGIVMGAVCVIDEDREQARALARREVALYLPVVAELDPSITLDPDFVAQLKTLAKQHDFVGAGELISDDILDRFAFSGNVSDIVRQCEALFDAGANRLEFGTPHGMDAYEGIRLLGEQVVPALKNYLS